MNKSSGHYAKSNKKGKGQGCMITHGESEKKKPKRIDKENRLVVA